MSRSYLWVVHFLLLPLGAYLVADILNQVVGVRLEASARPLAAEPESLPSVGEARRDYRSIIEGNIFNAKLREEETAVETGAPEAPSQPIQDLHISLIGTVVGTPVSGDDSFVIIQDRKKREQRLYRLGELIDQGARVVRIGREEVVLLRGGSETLLRLEIEEKKKSKGAKGNAAVSRQDGVQKVTSNRWVLDRQELDIALESLPKLLTKARVIPHFSGGKPSGFRIFSIVPGSFFSKIGLRNGDILQRINGIDIKDPEKFMLVFQQLKGQASVSLDLMRNNQKQTFQYEIR